MKNFLKYLPNIIIIIVSVALFFAMSQLIFNFDVEYLLSSEYWVTSIILVTIYTLSHWSAYDAKVKALVSNKNEKVKRDEYEAKIAKVANSFDWLDYKAIFITERNRKEKAKAYKIKIQNKLTRLNNRTSQRAKDLDLLVITEQEKKNLTDEQLKTREETINLKKLKCRYLRKKAFLEGELQDEWIQQNIDKISIKYNKITEQFVSTGGTIKELDIDYNDPKGKYAKENLPSRLQNMMITAALTAFAVDLFFSGLTPDAWFDFGVRCVMMLFNVIIGINYGKNYYDQIFIENLVNRLAITDQFLSYCKEIKRVGVSVNGSKNNSATV